MNEGYRTEAGEGRGNSPPTTVYRIRDATGKLVAEHVREDKPDGTKEVVWRLPDGTWGLNGTKLSELPLYGAERVSSWTDPDELIVLAEGEKACDALDRADYFNALGTVCGSGVVPGAEALELLRDWRVCLWPDNDEAGRKHMERIAERLHSIAAEVLIYTWDAAPEKGDAADHPSVQSRDRKALDKLLTDLESAPRWKPSTPNGEIEDVMASSVEIKPVEWLWKGRIPEGKLTMFDGDPDLGKSVVTMDIAARVSTGRGFPDGAPCEARHVIVANIEDGIEDTIVPRLKAHGADLDRVSIFQSVPDDSGGTRVLELPRDVVILENLILRRQAGLLILDPIITMLGGDANKDQDARKALAPVRDMAERIGCAVVCVRHLNKSVGLKAIQRGGGNMGLIGVVRAGSFFAEHPDDDRLRVMAAHKSNLAEKPPSLSYRVVSWAIDKNIARIEWAGVTDHDANSLASTPASPAEKSKQEEAREFLRDELADGPMWVKQVQMDARDAGISQGTLTIAKSQLRVRSEKIGTDGWQWSLPGSEDDKPPEGPDPLDPLDPLSPSNEPPPDSAYLREDDKDDKGDKDDSRPRASYHLPPGADRLIRATFEDDNGAALNLPLYIEGKTTLSILTNSVLGAMGKEWGKMGADERRAWEQAVERVVEDNGG